MAISTAIGTSAPMAMLLGLKGIDPEFAATLYSKGLFRHSDNRRQVAAYAGAGTVSMAERINRS